jgi:hypothetical protein
MGYPDKFEGYMIEDHKKWTDCTFCLPQLLRKQLTDGSQEARGTTPLEVVL